MLFTVIAIIERNGSLDNGSQLADIIEPDVRITQMLSKKYSPNGFVGSLPSTLSGHVINMRRVHGGGSDERRPLFTKLHELCCDERTAIDLMRLPGVKTLADVPCVPGEGNAWC